MLFFLMKKKKRSDENWSMLIKMHPLLNDITQTFQGCDCGSVERAFRIRMIS